MKHAEDGQFLKWSTSCLLRYLDLATLDSALVTPDEPTEKIESTARAFAGLTTNEGLMVRSDARAETKQYYRGGNTFPVGDAIREAQSLHADGRAVLFLEPTNRFNNLLSVNLVMDRDSGLSMEVLGRGFDVSDLNRGGIVPELSVQVANANWQQFEVPRAWDFRIQRYDDPERCRQRRELRLARMANDILPRLGHLNGSSLASAEKWLRERGYTGIWRDAGVTLSLRTLQKFYEDAFMIVDHLWQKPWRVLGCSASDLGDGRLIYWDIIYPTRKFGVF